MKILFTLLIYLLNPDYKILFFGHAYGSGDIENQSDLSFTNYIKNYSDDHNLFVFGGDFIKNCNSNIEIEKFKKNINRVYDDSIFIYGNHEFYCYESDNVEFIKKHENSSLAVKDNIMFFINSNFKNINQVEKLVDTISKSSNYSRIFIFNHQTFFEKNDLLLYTNSREFYELGYTFIEKISELNHSNIYFISGDIGSTIFHHDLIYYKKNNINMLASGLGNGKNNYGIEIVLSNNDEVNFNKLNLDSKEKTKLFPMNRMGLYAENLFLFLMLKIKSPKLIGILLLIISIVILFRVGNRLYKF